MSETPSPETLARARWSVYGEGCVLASDLIIPIFNTNGTHDRQLAKQLCDSHNAAIAAIEQQLEQELARERFTRQR